MQVNIGIIGLGTVGSGVVRLLQEQAAFFSSDLGLDLRLVAVCARTEQELAPFDLPGTIKTTDPFLLCRHPDIQVLVEVAGGYEEPRKWALCAIENGKHLVTANKALLAKHGSTLFPAAAKAGRALLFEASVGGGIPLIRVLQELLVANDITGLACIINGTCNYILSEMTRRKADFAEVLAEAQQKGYAEADPRFDVEGTDTAHKVALLASLCYGKYVDFQKMAVEGITRITKQDVELAGSLGYVIKLLGTVGLKGERAFVNVYPALVPAAHQLGVVNGVLNAVYIKGSATGPLLFTGAGAGQLPTASAVVGDIIQAARLVRSGREPLCLDYINAANALPLLPIDELETEFYLRISTRDETGALVRITAILAELRISIDSILQRAGEDQSEVPIIIITHTTLNREVAEAVRRIDALDVVTQPTQLLRFYR